MAWRNGPRLRSESGLAVAGRAFQSWVLELRALRFESGRTFSSNSRYSNAAARLLLWTELDIFGNIVRALASISGSAPRTMFAARSKAGKKNSLATLGIVPICTSAPLMRLVVEFRKVKAPAAFVRLLLENCLQIQTEAH